MHVWFFVVNAEAFDSNEFYSFCGVFWNCYVMKHGMDELGL